MTEERQREVNFTNSLVQKMLASIDHQARKKAEMITENAENFRRADHDKRITEACRQIDASNKNAMKKLEEQKVVAVSKAEGQEKMNILQAHEDAVIHAKERAAEKLQELTTKPEYEKLLHDLCLQGLMELKEEEVELCVVEKDQEIVNKIMDQLQSSYKEKMDGKEVTIKVAERLLPEAAIGGVLLSAKEGSIQCSNTLRDRLELIATAEYSLIRWILLPDQRSESEPEAIQA